MRHAYHGFELLDHVRRIQGHALDRFGLGPQQSPFEVVHEQAGLRLREYGTGKAQSAPLLIVPAPIKRPYIWDLAPERSVVRHALAHGFGVYLVEWAEPGAAFAPGLADYAGSMLADCIDQVRGRTGAGQVALCGHSLGGVFAAIHSAYRPDQVGALVAVDAPLHFAGQATEAPQPQPQSQTPGACIPGSLLSSSSMRAAPYTFGANRYLDRLASLASRDQTLTHWRVERWTLDELAMSRTLFDDLRILRSRNSFMSGELAIGAARLGPRQVRAPLFSVYQGAGGFIPADAVLAFHFAAASAVKELASYPGDTGVALQHVGPLVGENAHRHIWPRVFRWLAQV